MTTDEFTALVREHAPPDVASELLEIALTRHVERSDGRLYQNQVQGVIEDARAFARGLSGDHDTFVFPLDTPALGEISEGLVDAIEPWATEWRTKLARRYGVTLPFDGIRPALAWIEEAAEEGDDFPGDDRERMRAALQDPHIRELLGIRDPRTTLAISSRQPALALPDFDQGWVRHIAPHPGGLLFELAQELATVAERTQFEPWRILLLVLTGQHPRLPAVRVAASPISGGKLPGGEWVQAPMSVRVTFYTPELTAEALETVYGHLKATIWKVEDEKPLTERQRLVLEVVRQLGKPVAGRWEEFWLQVGDRMSALTDGAVSYTTPQGPHKLWKEARKKVSALTREEDN